MKNPQEYIQEMVDELLRGYGLPPSYFAGPPQRELSVSDVRQICETASRLGILCRIQRFDGGECVVTFIRDGRVVAEGAGASDRAALMSACEELREELWTP